MLSHISSRPAAIQPVSVAAIKLRCSHSRPQLPLCFLSSFISPLSTPHLSDMTSRRSSSSPLVAVVDFKPHIFNLVILAVFLRSHLFFSLPSSLSFCPPFSALPALPHQLTWTCPLCPLTLTLWTWMLRSPLSSRVSLAPPRACQAA